MKYLFLLLTLSACASDGHSSKFWQALGAMGNGMQQGAANARSSLGQQCDLRQDGMGGYTGTCR